jgi:hypothetical protein
MSQKSDNLKHSLVFMGMFTFTLACQFVVVSCKSEVDDITPNNFLQIQ